MDDTRYKLASKKIRNLRQSHGFSQEYMAQKLGISQNVYSLNEKNIQNIPLGRFIRIALILGVRVDQLLE